MPAAAAAAKSLQSCPTLCDPIDSSPPGSPVPGILQARTLEWVAISLSNAWKWKVKLKSLSHVRPSATPWTAAFQAPQSMGFSRHEYWSGMPLPSPAAMVNKTDPILLQDNAHPHVTQSTVQKLNELDYEVLPHPPHSPETSCQQTTTSSSISTTFCRENASTIISRRQKMLSKNLSNPKAWIFTLRDKPTYFLLAKMCWL